MKMSEKFEINKTDFKLENTQLSVAKNLFSLFQPATLNQKPKIKRVEEDEFEIREYEDDFLVKVTSKPKPPPPPKLPPRSNANSKFFASAETPEKTATNDQRNFVITHPGFIRELMKDHDVAQHLQLLSDGELMQLYKYQHNINQLIDAGVSMSKLFSLDSTLRNIIICNADVIISLMKSGSTFEQISTMSNDELMHCVHEHRASEATQSLSPAAQGLSM